MSDTHVNADETRVYRGVNMADNLRRVCREILVLGDAPAGVMINGDLAHLRGQTADYATAIRLLAPLRQMGLPIHVALGNHDSRERFRAALPTDERSMDLSGGRHVSVVELPRANVFMLDSNDGTDHLRGALGPDQLDWLARALDTRPNKPAVVMVHHQPEIGFSFIPSGIADTAALLRVLSPRRQAKAIFYGHLHRWTHQQRPDGLHLVNLPATAYLFERGQPSGWVDARIFDTGATLELRSLDTAHPQHARRLPLSWRV